MNLKLLVVTLLVASVAADVNVNLQKQIDELKRHVEHQALELRELREGGLKTAYYDHSRPEYGAAWRYLNPAAKHFASPTDRQGILRFCDADGECAEVAHTDEMIPDVAGKYMSPKVEPAEPWQPWTAHEMALYFEDWLSEQRGEEVADVIPVNGIPYKYIHPPGKHRFMGLYDPTSIEAKYCDATGKRCEKVGLEGMFVVFTEEL